MSASAIVPLCITPEAAARLAELGMRAELEKMIDEARQVLPELTRIEVVLNDRYDMGGEPGVAAHAYGKAPSAADDKIFWKMADRIVTKFPPEVLEHLTVDYYPGEPHAG